MSPTNIITKLFCWNSSLRCRFSELSNTNCIGSNKVILNFQRNGLRKLHSKTFKNCRTENKFCSPLNSHSTLTIFPGREVSFSRQSLINVPANRQASQSAKKSKEEKLLLLAEVIKKEDEEFAILKKSHHDVFALPKSNLHNTYSIISSQLNNRHSVQYKYKEISKTPAYWECHASVEWPTHAEFTSRASSKGEAANRASLLALLWLQEIRQIDKKGAVEQIFDAQRNKQSPIAEIQLSPDTMEKIELVVNRFDQEINQIINSDTTESSTSFEDKHISKGCEEDVEFKFENESRSKEDKSMMTHQFEKRNQDLLTRLEGNKNRRNNISSLLPIHSFQENLVHLISKDRVLVVEGEPGCGKSTQVPQYILESFINRGLGTDCNLIVTQPRRISAVALAERVALERDEQVGDVVGYHVRLDAKIPRYENGYILFCSTGILLRKMLQDPSLNGVSHVIVDEAHERSIEVDFLMLLLKRALNLNSKLRVLIMSATINTELFTQFFDNCPSISIPGFTHPVQAHYLNEDMKCIMESGGARIESEEIDQPSINIPAIVKMITFIDETKPEGAILVFLPGWFEIKSIMEEMASLKNTGHFFVVPAHSKLSNKDQKLIFEVPVNKRKVILSTNIAETSLTINDVIYVIDCGAVKEERLDVKRGLVCLDSHWVSQANVLQRRGRAGRVQPGESYHLFTESKFESLNKFPTPEIHRVPLTRTVLEVKMYSKDENLVQFLSCLPEPPSIESLTQAIQVLQSIGALDQEENLTALGKRIYKLPLDPHLSKALVHACLFKCVDPMVTISTVVSADFPIFQDTLGTKNKIREIKQELCATSDHLALNKLYSEWQNRNWIDREIAKTYCDKNNVVSNNMERISQLRALHVEHLRFSKLIPQDENINDSFAESNTFSAHPELVKSLLLSGLGNVLSHQTPVSKRGFHFKILNGNPAILSNASVNSKARELTSPFLTYFKSISSSEKRVVLVQESSLLSPLSVVLFFPGSVIIKPVDELDTEKCIITIPGAKSVNISIKQKEGEQLLQLRQVVWKMLDYFVENEEEPVNIDQYKVASAYRDDLLCLLVNILAEYSSNHAKTSVNKTDGSPSNC